MNLSSCKRKLVYALVFFPLVAGQCPNMCSGHGDCGAENVCSCFDGFDYAPDCSLRTCAYGAAWADKAYAIDRAHSLTECSNAGLCNRDTGKCECFDGYTGLACHRCMTRVQNHCMATVNFPISCMPKRLQRKWYVPNPQPPWPNIWDRLLPSQHGW